MKKIIIILFFVLASVAGGYAIMTSYGSITGHATVSQSIKFDILESYSDVNTSATDDSKYTLKSSYQGETKWVKLNIKNAADTWLPANIEIGMLEGSANDINITILDSNKTFVVKNPLNISSGSNYLWIMHDFKASATPGAFSFVINVAPAERYA